MRAILLQLGHRGSGASRDSRRMLAVWSRNTTGVLDATRSISSYFVIRPIVARLEKTNELLELIQGLMPDIETAIQPQPATTPPID